MVKVNGGKIIVIFGSSHDSIEKIYKQIAFFVQMNYLPLSSKNPIYLEDGRSKVSFALFMVKKECTDTSSIEKTDYLKKIPISRLANGYSPIRGIRHSATNLLIRLLSP